MAGHSIAGALEAGARRLAAAGVPDARGEARRLWAGLHGSTAGASWLSRGEPIGPDDEAAFEDAVRRRSAGEPLAYVTGVQGFRTLDLAVDRSVLIPRPETEGLVAAVLEWCRGARGDGPGACWGTALDVGTGSGCIALSLAVEGRFARVIGTDCSAAALAVARRNLARVRPATGVELRLGAVLDPVSDEICDVIVSNPPYVAETEFAMLARGVREYEPREALVSGQGGLSHTRRLLSKAGAHLAPGGLLAIEVDSRRAGTALEIARAAGWRDARLARDVFGRLRFLLATKGNQP